MTTGRRDTTNVPAQALGLLNHPFVHEQAARHADRLLAGTPHAPDVYFTELYRTILGRPPSADEVDQCRQLFAALRDSHGLTPDAARRDVRLWRDLIHVLYNLQEFTYVL
jgi:hypothetical protein